MPKRHFIFRLWATLLLLFSIEGGLHVVSFAAHTIKTKKDYQDLFFPIYKDQAWAKTLFKELAEGSKENVGQVLLWLRKEYHGEYVNIDSNGLRRTWEPPHFSNKTVQTIFMFGGSTAWGSDARDEGTIPSHLSKLFYQNGTSFQVVNYAQSAYTVLQEILQLILLLKEGHRPDYVLFYDGINDVVTAYLMGLEAPPNGLANIREKFESESHWRSLWSGFKGLLGQYCATCKAIHKIVDFVFTRKAPSAAQTATINMDAAQQRQLAKNFAAYYKMLTGIIDHLSRTYGFHYILFWQPAAFTEDHLTPEEEIQAKRVPRFQSMAQFYEEVNKVLDNMALPHFYDLSSALKERRKPYYMDTSHLSEEGNALVAGAIFKHFQKAFLPSKISQRKR